MKLTKVIKEVKDHRGNIIDFKYCRNCNSFIQYENKDIGYEITCNANELSGITNGTKTRDVIQKI